MKNQSYSKLTILTFAIIISNLFFISCSKNSDLVPEQNTSNTTSNAKDGYITLGKVPSEILLSSVENINGTYYTPFNLTNPIEGDFTLEFYNATNDKMVASRAVVYNNSYAEQEFKVPFGRYYLKIKDNKDGVYRNLPCPTNRSTKVMYFDVKTEEKISGFTVIVLEKLQ